MEGEERFELALLLLLELLLLLDDVSVRFVGDRISFDAARRRRSAATSPPARDGWRSLAADCERACHVGDRCDCESEGEGVAMLEERLSVEKDEADAEFGELKLFVGDAAIVAVDAGINIR